MKTYIEEYFKNPKNVMTKKIYANSEIVTPEIFFEMMETEQENTTIIFKKIKCKDGFTMSVQASYGHYCDPRITLFSKYIFIYQNMEVGYPSEKVEELMEYSCQEEGVWEGVYANVPVTLLNEIIEKHGGIK